MAIIENDNLKIQGLAQKFGMRPEYNCDYGDPGSTVWIGEIGKVKF